MRTVDSRLIAETVKELCIKANIEERHDILSALKAAKKKERSARAKRVLDIIIENARLAKEKKLPICQDTGMVVVYLNIGQLVRIKGGLAKAVQKGVIAAYKEGYFRKSVVRDPLTRKNTKTNLPPIINTKIVPGNKINIRVVIKGFGCENASKIRMFLPTDSRQLIEDFIVNTIEALGSRACPPIYLGVGIGATADKAAALSKEAVLRRVGKSSNIPHVARLEKRILKRINKLNIGPMGSGGATTALGVSILTHPTHIAGLPVAINISCHATRDAGKVI